MLKRDGAVSDEDEPEGAATAAAASCHSDKAHDFIQDFLCAQACRSGLARCQTRTNWKIPQQQTLPLPIPPLMSRLTRPPMAGSPARRQQRSAADWPEPRIHHRVASRSGRQTACFGGGAGWTATTGQGR